MCPGLPPLSLRATHSSEEVEHQHVGWASIRIPLPQAHNSRTGSVCASEGHACVLSAAGGGWMIFCFSLFIISFKGFPILPPSSPPSLPSSPHHFSPPPSSFSPSILIGLLPWIKTWHKPLLQKSWLLYITLIICSICWKSADGKYKRSNYEKYDVAEMLPLFSYIIGCVFMETLYYTEKVI